MGINDIKFNGRPAMVWEMVGRDTSARCILITDDTIASIFVDAGETGLRAWDILNKFTVSQT